MAKNRPPAWVLKQLRNISGLDVKTKPNRPDTIAIKIEGGPVTNFTVYKERISEERAAAIAKLQQNQKTKTLFVTTFLTPRARALLSSAAKSWIERDTHRTYLRAPGILVNVDGTNSAEQTRSKRRLSSSRQPAALLRDRSGVVAETILSTPGGTSLTVSQLAVAARVSPALVSRLMSRLTRLGILKVHGRGPHKYWVLVDAPALLDQWATEERSPEEVTGASVWFESPVALGDRLRSLEVEKIDYAVGGVAAANLHLPSLSGVPTTDIWISAALPVNRVLTILGADRAERGANIRFCQTSKDPALVRAQKIAAAPNNASHLYVISPYRAYVEAERSAGRGRDVAQALRRSMELKV